MLLPKPNEFGSFVLKDAIIYASGKRLPTAGKWMIWRVNGGFVMDRKGPKYFESPEQALQFHRESK